MGLIFVDKETTVIKNSKKRHLRGDYNLVKVDNEVVAIVLCAQESTSRKAHQGTNEFSIFCTMCRNGYTVKEDDINVVPNLPLGRRHGRDIGVTLCRVVPARNHEWGIHVPVHPKDIQIEEFSSIQYPLKAKWGYYWNNYITKEEERKTVSLCDETDVEKLPFISELLVREYDKVVEHFIDKKMIPSFEEKYSLRQDAEIETLKSDNNNYLIHDIEDSSYVWYDESGAALKYTNRGEFLHLRQKLQYCYRDATLFARKINISLPEHSDEDLYNSAFSVVEPPTPRRERRKRSTERNAE